ncbi:unnamed protein product [Calicophoron daubneyi]|uniref:Uncharacterized protein n=1 Tax=Calicophoron daubneyi TaxID=300641 RepID=A0AAV2T7E3_CALDB
MRLSTMTIGQFSILLIIGLAAVVSKAAIPVNGMVLPEIEQHGFRSNTFLPWYSEGPDSEPQTRYFFSRTMQPAVDPRYLRMAKRMNFDPILFRKRFASKSDVFDRRELRSIMDPILF